MNLNTERNIQTIGNTPRIKPTERQTLGVVQNTNQVQLGSIPRNFKNFIFKAKLSFWGKITKMLTRMNFQIFTNSPYIWFLQIFHINSHHRNGYFQKINFKRDSYIGWIRTNPEIHPSYFCDFPSKRTI